MKRAFITGVTGYIGGALAHQLQQDGYSVLGLVRTPAAAEQVAARGIEPVVGLLDDGPLLERLARSVDVVINAADSDHRPAIEALVRGLEGTHKTIIHTSGSSVVSDVGTGVASERVYPDTEPFTPIPDKEARVALDRFVLDSARRGIRAMVVCPTMIYGRGPGVKRDSIQVPVLIRESQRQGAGVYLGEGLNTWSNIHIEDLMALYARVLEQGQAGDFFFAEGGEARLKDIAAAISQGLGLGGRTVSWALPEAIAALGEGMARHALASNSRVRAVRARKLGWSPQQRPLLEEISSGSYREDFGPSARST